MRRIAVAIPLLAAVMLMIGCRDSEERPVVLSDLTLDEVYARMEAALAGDGDQVLHASVVVTGVDYDLATPIPTPEGFEDFDSEAYADQVWIDSANGAARVETRTRYDEESEDRVYRHIVAGDRLLRVDDEGRSGDVDAIRCRGSESPLIAQLFRCNNWLEESTTVVESDEYDRGPAIVLHTSGELPSHDWTVEFESRLFVDPDSYLPLAATATQTGGPVDGSYTLTYRYDIEFVERSSLPNDFFEPATIGFVQQKPIPADNLAPEIKGVRIYWLGETFDAGLSAPLALQQPRVYPGDKSPTEAVASMSYKIEGDRTGYRGIGVGNYPIDVAATELEAFELYWKDEEDVTRTDTTINGYRAEVYRMATDYGDLYLAHIYYESTLVVVSDYLGAPPYTGQSAFMRVLEGLLPFEN